MSEALKKGTLKCPECKVRLDFELLVGMRVIRGGFYDSYCNICGKYRPVVANKHD